MNIYDTISIVFILIAVYHLGKLAGFKQSNKLVKKCLGKELERIKELEKLLWIANKKNRDDLLHPQKKTDSD